MEENKWVMHRAGLFNFWYYDDETFDFADGKLLLRGSNGSGKSVTMQSLLPVLLDGRKSPDRLDPFGSKARKMEDYLLGEKEVSGHEERTGYLYLEYKRQHSDQYITTGIGLKAKRGKNLESWGFVLRDGRRIGHDFLLYKKEKGIGEERKIPFSKRELEHRIDHGGEVVSGQREYMELVNRHLFQFESLEGYEDLIKLLIQLRSPKLSKDFKPTVIYEILESSLPPLLDDDLRTLADTVESMDAQKQQLEQQQSEYAALKGLSRAYTNVNRLLLVEKAEAYLQCVKEKADMEKEIALLREEKKTLLEKHEGLVEEQRGNNRNNQVYKERQRHLQQHEVFGQEESLRKEKERYQDLKVELGKLEDKVSMKQEVERRLRRELDQLQDNISQERKERDEAIDELDDIAEQAMFSAHTMNKEQYFKRVDGFDFSLWEKEAKEFDSLLEQVLVEWAGCDEKKYTYVKKEEEAGKLQQQLDEHSHQYSKWSEIAEEERERLVKKFYEWNNSYSYLEKEELISFIDRLDRVYEAFTYEQVKQPIYDAKNRKSTEIHKKIVGVAHEAEQLKKEKTIIEEELQEWKHKKEPEPIRSNYTNHSRKELSEKGIPFVPFYAAIEFHDGVVEEVKRKIESALVGAGLLDAIIVNEEIDIQNDKLLRSNPQLFSHTLENYVYVDRKIDHGVDFNKIEGIIQSIVVESDSKTPDVVTICEDGSYRIGLVQGHGICEENIGYVGREARKRKRQGMIVALEEKITAIEEGIEKKEKEITVLNECNEEMNSAFDSFPVDKDLHYAYDQQQSIAKEVRKLQEQKEKMELEVKEAKELYQKASYQLRQMVESAELPFEKSFIQQAKKEMVEYKEAVSKLKVASIRLTHQQENLVSKEERLQEVQEEVDELKGNTTIKKDSIGTIGLHIESLETLLQAQGLDEIRAQITEVEDMLQTIEANIPRLEREITSSENNQNQVVTTLEVGMKKQEFTEQLCWGYEQLFNQECKWVLPKEEEKSSIQRAKEVCKEYNHMKKQQGVESKYVGEFRRVMAILMDYHLQEASKVYSCEGLIEAFDEVSVIRLEEFTRRCRRVHCTLDYKGRTAAPAMIEQEWKEELERQQLLLNNADRQLYEDILLNNIGRIIRERVKRAQTWVEKIDTLMQARDTSSGLVLSIKWKPRSGEYEGELDTKELVTILQKNASLLKDEDLTKVTNHFRSKIQHAREIMEDGRNGDTLHNVMKEVLDYRKWFSFKLYYTKPNEPKRELTNNAFFKFSGGEKAMSMYIPLFTAAYSRYKEAGKDAPFIISLDEAFAGVDENNIRDMFQLVESLGFNYIVNSQALWGDYDTVSQLSICELVRPKNADYVTVIRYHWDGKVKALMNKVAEPAQV